MEQINVNTEPSGLLQGSRQLLPRWRVWRAPFNDVHVSRPGEMPPDYRGWPWSILRTCGSEDEALAFAKSEKQKVIAARIKERVPAAIKQEREDLDCAMDKILDAPATVKPMKTLPERDWNQGTWIVDQSYFNNEYTVYGPGERNAGRSSASFGNKLDAQIFARRMNETTIKSGLSFGEAIERLKAGKKIARQGWNGQNMFLFLVPGSTFKVSRAPLLGIYPEGTEINYHAHIDMRTATGEIVPWLASQTDLLAEDWVEV